MDKESILVASEDSEERNGRIRTCTLMCSILYEKDRDEFVQRTEENTKFTHRPEPGSYTTASKPEHPLGIQLGVLSSRELEGNQSSSSQTSSRHRRQSLHP